MNNPTEIKLPKWPFFLGDAVLLGLAYFMYLNVKLPLGRWECVLFALTASLGAMLAVLPFLLEFRAAARMVETGAMVSTISQIQNLEELAGHITSATSQWQAVQEHSTGAVNAAKEIAGKMASEKAAFTEFLKKAHDSERANLRLELEKMRRSEGDWIQIVVRLLDHTYALYQAAIRSGQAGVIEQIAQFQSSCRDVARRAGLVPFAPATDELFDPKCHHSTDSQAVSMADAKVRDTIATGYTYQGQMIRPALVSLQNPPPTGMEDVEPANDAAVNEVSANETAEEQTLL
jgi:molecular chaperone GrpE (heat shock protein)